MRSNKGTVREYEMFKNIVASFMKEINELNEAPSIYYSLQFTELVYKNDKTEMPLFKTECRLSVSIVDGYGSGVSSTYA